MSMESNYYVIAGYDLTGYETDKFDKWRWTEEGEEYLNNQRKGEIQFFDDPMSGSYLYFGYVLADGDEYSFQTTSFEMSEIEKCFGKVQSELVKLQEMGVIISTATPFLRRVPVLVRFMRHFSCRSYFFWTVILFSRCCSERS